MLAVLTMLFLFAQLPATVTMNDRGVSITDLEFAGSSAASHRMVETLEHPGRVAAAWQLVIDFPFLIAYGLLIAGLCLAVGGALARAGSGRLGAVVSVLALTGPIAAACDLSQNIGLFFVINQHTQQPFPRISQIGGYATLTLAGIGIVAIGVGVAVLLMDRLRTFTVESAK